MEILKDVTLGELLNKTVNKYPKRPAIEYLDKCWTYEQLDEKTDEIAKGLLALGITKGTHVGIWANDRPNTLLCLYSLFKIGAVAVMLGTSLTKSELESRLIDTDTDYLLFDEGFKNTDFIKICNNLNISSLKKLIYIGLSPQNSLFSLDDLCELGNNISTERLSAAKSTVTASDPDVILFTSGTTSSPKGVVTTHFSRVNNIRAQAEALNTTHMDKFLIALPIFHCFSLSGSVLAAMAAGACVCFPENRRTHTILNTIEKSRCTIFTAVPTLFSAILARQDLKDFDLTSLRTGLIGGSMYPPSMFKRICETLNYDLLPSLGQTEATAGLTMGDLSDPLEVRATTIGRFMEHIEGCIMDEAGNKLPVGQQGEICIRGYNLMVGYYKRPDLTSKVIDKDGWLHTGDIGYQDDDGNIYLTGRLKDLIIRGGENIAPGEIENIIAEMPGVRQVKVVGVPDTHYIEEVCACVVCENNANLTPEDIREYVGKYLAYFKIPKYIIFIDEIPINCNGKFDTAKCKQLAIDKLSLEK